MVCRHLGLHMMFALLIVLMGRLPAHALVKNMAFPTPTLIANYQSSFGELSPSDQNQIHLLAEKIKHQSPVIEVVYSPLDFLWPFSNDGTAQKPPAKVPPPSDHLWCASGSSWVGKVAYCQDLSGRPFTLSGFSIGTGISASLMVLSRLPHDPSQPAEAEAEAAAAAAEDFPGNYAGYIGDAGYTVPGIAVPIAGGIAIGLLQKVSSTKLLPMRLRITGVTVAPLPFANINTSVSIQPMPRLW